MTVNFALFAVPALIVCLLMLPLVPVYRGVATGKKARFRVIFQLCGFFGVMLLALVLPVGD